MKELVNDENKINKLAIAGLLGLIVLFIISRCVYLERDLPSSVICSYVAIDELYYTIPAFNLYHYNEAVHNVVPFINDDSQPTNIVENILTFFSLSIFGNNYYGLRMASVFTALIIYIFLYLIIKKILNGRLQEGCCNKPDNVKNLTYVLFFIMAYILCDFSFLMAGRTAEPTIFRMLAMVFMIYIASLPCLSTGKLESKWYSILLGFLSLAAVVFVYIYNAFIFCAFALSVFIWACKAGFKNAIKQSMFFLIGSILCLLVYQFYIDITYHVSLAEVYQHLIPYQNRMGLGAGLTDRIGSYLVNIIFLFLTNIFRFNIIILFIFLISLPVFIKKVKTDRNNFDILILNLVVFLIMQSIIINDYPLRKLIILLPLAAIVITSSYTYFTKNLTKFINLAKGKELINRTWFTAGIISLFVTALYFSPGLSGESSFILGKFMYLNLGVFIIIGSIMVLTYFFNVYIPRIFIVAILILMLLPNLYMDSKYVFLNRTFYFRDAMISMSEKVDGKITVGGCSYGFRLYNESIPIMDFYKTINSTKEGAFFDENFDRMFAEGIDGCSIAYTDENPDAPIGIDYMSRHGLKLAEEYPLGEIVGTNVGVYVSADRLN